MNETRRMTDTELTEQIIRLFKELTSEEKADVLSFVVTKNHQIK